MTIFRRSNLLFKSIATALVCLFFVNDLAWAIPGYKLTNPPNKATLAPESRFNPFFEKYGLDFKHMAAVTYAAARLNEVVTNNPLKGLLIEREINRLNRLFPDGTVKIGQGLRPRNFKGKEYKSAIFDFVKEGKRFDLLFLERPGLDGVWFVNHDSATAAQSSASSKTGWINQGIMYEVMIKDFGNIINITKEIPRLSKLGIKIIWLCGIMSNRNGNEPFAVLDNFKLEPSAGTEEQLKQFLDVAHNNGLKVIMDFIPNHVSIKSPLLETHPDWFIRNEKGEVADATDDIEGNYKWPGLAQLDIAKIEVQNYLMSVAQYWLNFGFDGFRIDASSSMIKERIKKNWYRGREEIVDKLMPVEFWQNFIHTLKGRYPDADFFAEAHTYRDYLEKMGMDLVLDTGFAHVLYEILKEDRKPQDLRNYLEESPLSSLLRRAHLKDGHDVRDVPGPGDQRLLNFDTAELKLASLLIQTIPGTPVLYNGEPEAVLDYIYKANEVNTIHWDRCDQKLRAFNEKAVALGRSPVFRNGAFRFLEPKIGQNPSIFAFEREYKGEKVIVVANLSANKKGQEEACHVNLDIDSILDNNVKEYYFEDMLENEKFALVDSNVLKEHGFRINLRPKEIRIFKLSPLSYLKQGVFPDSIPIEQGVILKNGTLPPAPEAKQAEVKTAEKPKPASGSGGAHASMSGFGYLVGLIDIVKAKFEPKKEKPQALQISDKFKADLQPAIDAISIGREGDEKSGDPELLRIALLRAIAESRGNPAAYKKLAYELALILIAYPEEAGFATFFLYQDLHRYEDYKIAMAITGIAGVIASHFSDEHLISDLFRIPHGSIISWNDGERNQNRICGFLRDELQAMKFVKLLREGINDGGEPWYIDSQIAILDAIQAIDYKTPGILREARKYLSKLKENKGMSPIVKERLVEVLNVLRIGGKRSSYDSLYQEAIAQFTEFAAQADGKDITIANLIKELNSGMPRDDVGRLATYNYERSHLAQREDSVDIYENGSEYGENEARLREALKAVHVDYDQSARLVLGDEFLKISKPEVKPAPSESPAMWARELGHDFEAYLDIIPLGIAYIEACDGLKKDKGIRENCNLLYGYCQAMLKALKNIRKYSLESDSPVPEQYINDFIESRDHILEALAPANVEFLMDAYSRQPDRSDEELPQDFRNAAKAIVWILETQDRSENFDIRELLDIAGHYELEDKDIVYDPVITSAANIYGRKGEIFRAIVNILRDGREELQRSAVPMHAGRVSAQVTFEGRTFVLKISDNGRGMPEAKVKAFNRGEGVASSKKGDSGHGLKKAREMLARNGGTIEAAADYGENTHGTTFTIKLPAVGKPEEAKPAPSEKPAMRKPKDKMPRGHFIMEPQPPPGPDEAPGTRGEEKRPAAASTIDIPKDFHPNDAVTELRKIKYALRLSARKIGEEIDPGHVRNEHNMESILAGTALLGRTTMFQILTGAREAYARIAPVKLRAVRRIFCKGEETFALFLNTKIEGANLSGAVVIEMEEGRQSIPYAVMHRAMDLFGKEKGKDYVEAGFGYLCRTIGVSRKEFVAELKRWKKPWERLTPEYVMSVADRVAVEQHLKDLHKKANLKELRDIKDAWRMTTKGLAEIIGSTEPIANKILAGNIRAGDGMVAKVKKFYAENSGTRLHSIRRIFCVDEDAFADLLNTGIYDSLNISGSDIIEMEEGRQSIPYVVMHRAMGLFGKERGKDLSNLDFGVLCEKIGVNKKSFGAELKRGKKSYERLTPEYVIATADKITGEKESAVAENIRETPSYIGPAIVMAALGLTARRFTAAINEGYPPAYTFKTVETYIYNSHKEIPGKFLERCQSLYGRESIVRLNTLMQRRGVTCEDLAKEMKEKDPSIDMSGLELKKMAEGDKPVPPGILIIGNGIDRKKSGPYLKQLKEGSGMTVKNFAARIGISWPMYQSMCQGECIVPDDVMYAAQTAAKTNTVSIQKSNFRQLFEGRFGTHPQFATGPDSNEDSSIGDVRQRPDKGKPIKLGGVSFKRFEVKDPARKILILEPIDEKVLEMMRRDGRISYDVLCPEDEPLTKERLAKIVIDPAALHYDTLYVFVKYSFNKEFLALLPDLKEIIHFSTGYNNTVKTQDDVNYLRERGITVTYAPGPLTNAMAELNVGLMLDAKFRLTDETHFYKRMPGDTATLEEALAGKDDTAAQILWGQLLRKSLRLDAMYGLRNKWDGCGIGGERTVLHNQLATDKELGIDTKLGFVGGGALLKELAGIARAHEITTPIYYYNSARLDRGDEEKLGLIYVGSPGDLKVCDYVLRLPGSAVRLKEQGLEAIGREKVIDPERIYASAKFAGLAGDSLAGKTLAIAGLGRIGCSFANRAKAFGLNVIGHDNKYSDIAKDIIGESNLVTKEELFARKPDIFSPLLTLNSDTERWVGQRELSLLKKDAIVINTSRGQIFDEEALIDFARTHPEAAIRIDVLTDESRTGDRRLLDAPNVKCTCHTGSAVVEVRREMARVAWVENLLRIIDGKPPRHLIKELLASPEPKPAEGKAAAVTLSATTGSAESENAPAGLSNPELEAVKYFNLTLMDLQLARDNLIAFIAPRKANIKSEALDILKAIITEADRAAGTILGWYAKPDSDIVGDPDLRRMLEEAESKTGILEKIEGAFPEEIRSEAMRLTKDLTYKAVSLHDAAMRLGNELLIRYSLELLKGNTEEDLLAKVRAALSAMDSSNTYTERIISAFKANKREEFVPAELKECAYADTPLPIGYGQTISQPALVAEMTALLELNGNEAVLEVGTGSGYQAAILGSMAPAGKIYSLETIESLADTAKERLARIGRTNVEVLHRSGIEKIFPDETFDRIIAAAAAEEVPQAIIDELKTGGIIIIPVGKHGGDQKLMKGKKTRDASGKVSMEWAEIFGVRFVPFIGTKQVMQPSPPPEPGEVATPADAAATVANGKGVPSEDVPEAPEAILVVGVQDPALSREAFGYPHTDKGKISDVLSVSDPLKGADLGIVHSKGDEPFAGLREPYATNFRELTGEIGDGMAVPEARLGGIGFESRDTLYFLHNSLPPLEPLALGGSHIAGSDDSNTASTAIFQDDHQIPSAIGLTENIVTASSALEDERGIETHFFDRLGDNTVTGNVADVNDVPVERADSHVSPSFDTSIHVYTNDVNSNLKNSAVSMAAAADAAARNDVINGFNEASDEAERIYKENLKREYMPVIPNKTILCHIIPDSILPAGQGAAWLDPLQSSMRGVQYSEKVAYFAADSSGKFADQVQDAMTKAENSYRETYGEEAFKDYTVEFDVACPSTEEVGKIREKFGDKVRALAFERCDDPEVDAVQAHVIILALRALRTDDLMRLKTAYKFLGGEKSDPDLAKIMTIEQFVMEVTFKLPSAKKLDNDKRKFNELISKYIRQAA